MPYIVKEDRAKFEDLFEDFSLEELSKHITSPGQLNYVITKLCHGYIEKFGKDYTSLNAVHGVLNCAENELYRRVTAPYEDIKIKENGDI